MKITLTLEEAKNELALRFNEINESSGVRVTEADVTIEAVNPPACANYVESICRMQREFPNCHLAGAENKIPAIKRLRELTGINLAEAKAAAERPDEAINHWIRYASPLKLY